VAVMEALLGKWPDRVPATTSGGMRLLTAGRLLEDSKTLAECRVPKYEGHPTPVNVSVLPKGKSYTEITQSGERAEKPKTAAGGSAAAGAPGAGSASRGGAGPGGGAPPPGSGGGCCVIG